jgi:flagellar motor switch protein FliM
MNNLEQKSHEKSTENTNECVSAPTDPVQEQENSRLSSDDHLTTEDFKNVLRLIDNPLEECKTCEKLWKFGQKKKEEEEAESSAYPIMTEEQYYKEHKLSNDQMRTIQYMHERITRSFAAQLGKMLHCECNAKLINVDQYSYSEFLFVLENPSYYCRLRSECNPERIMYLNVDPKLAFAMIGRMLGDSSPMETTRRPLSRIECALVKHIVDLFLYELNNVWADIVKMDAVVDCVETHVRLFHDVAPRELICTCDFEVAFADIRGGISLCYPYEHMSIKNSNRFKDICKELLANW